MSEYMDGPAMCGKKEPKEPKVIAQVEILRRISNELSGRLAILEDRLSPVIISQSEEVCSDEPCLDHQVPLANALSEIAANIEGMAERLVSIDSRLEI